MAYYMRYILNDTKATNLDVLQQAMQEDDADYRIEPSGELYHADELFAKLEINSTGESLFDEEVDELIESVSDATGPGKQKVLDSLKSASGVLAVQVLFGDRSSDEVLDLLDPLWFWLIDNRKGLLQADGEGYYEGKKLILEVE